MVGFHMMNKGSRNASVRAPKTSAPQNTVHIWPVTRQPFSLKNATCSAAAAMSAMVAA